MPIDLRALKAPENRFLALSGDETLRTAFRKLIAVASAQPWWHLVVDLGAGRWAVATCDRLYALARRDRRLLDVALEDLGALVQVTVVEQASMGTDSARQLSVSSPASLLAVTRDGVLAGILYTPTLAGEAVTNADIEALAESPPADTPFALPATPGETVRRYVEVACPDRVALNTSFGVRVDLRVRRPPAEAGATALDASLREPLWVEIHASEFAVLTDPVREVRLLRGEDSPRVEFELRPRRTGLHRIDLEFYQQTTYLGSVGVMVFVAEVARSSQPMPRGLDLAATDARVAPADFLLRIQTEGTADRAWRFSLSRRDAPVEEFRAVPLQQDPAVYASRLLARLTALAPGWSVSPATSQSRSRADEVRREIKRRGQNLWEVLPVGFRELYARERAHWHDRSLQIVSEEPYIPWELVWPWGEDWEDDGPWCVTIRLSRWLVRGAAGPPATLPVRAVACLASGEPGLPNTVAERDYLRKLAGQYGFQDLTPTDFTRTSLTELLESGGYDWLHLATHGSFSEQAPDQEAAIRLGDSAHLTPEDLVGPAIAGHLRRRRPAIVLNACDTGRLSWGLVGLGGWANRLLSLGAGMFLGTLWQVDDASALRLIRDFYQNLWPPDGIEVGEALLLARRKARERNDADPSWLAYSLYSHPNARCTRLPR